MIIENYRREYNGLLDILKFIFSILIIFSHGIFLAEEGNALFFGYALIGVEFFFVVSGYLLMCTLYSRHLTLREFIIRRICGLYTYFIVAYLFCFFCWLYLLIINENPGKWILLTRILKAPFEFFFLNSSGISTAGVNGTWWYISAMLFAEWLLYPIILYKEKWYLYYLAPLSLFLISGYMSFNYGTIATGTFSGFIKTDNLRAILGIMSGTMVFYFVEKVKHYKFKKLVKYICNFVSVLGYGLIFILAFNNTKTIHEYTDGNLGFVTLPILFVCVSITCLNEFKKIKPICKWLGKLSTCIYLVHWQCMTMIKTMCEKKIINWGGTYHQKLIVLVVSSFLIANIVLFISEIGRNFIIKNKKIFFENSFNE